MKKLIITGGGTGGHVLPGVAVADQWKKKFGKEAIVLFVGAHGGLEEKLVPKAGYPLELLSIGSLKGAGIMKKLRTLFQLPFSILRSWVIIGRVKPDVVIGVGGYASGPFLLAAAFVRPFYGYTTAILEFNAIPGFTNRLLGRLVQKIFLAFDSQGTGFSSSKLLVTGTPVRSNLMPLAPARVNPLTIFIFGGSQGALGVNTLVIGALDHLGSVFPDWKNQLRFIHQTGEKDFDRVSEAYRKAGAPARVEKFIHDMASAYAEASLLICRAGASTLSEIATVRRAAILVPLPTAADNHQYKNAELFSRKNAAILLSQKETSSETMARRIADLALNPGQIHDLERNVQQFHRPAAAQTVVDALVQIDPGAHSA